VSTFAARPAPDATDPVIAVCATHEAAQQLVAALNRAGFDMTKVSLVGKGFASPEGAHGFFTIGERVKSWAATGSLWGAGWGLMLGAAIVVMPPIGVVTAAGPFVAMLLAVLEGAAVVGGVSAIAAVLANIGVSPERAANYESDVKADRFLVIVHGSAADIARARTTCEQRRQRGHCREGRPRDCEESSIRHEDDRHDAGEHHRPCEEHAGARGVAAHRERSKPAAPGDVQGRGRR